MRLLVGGGNFPFLDLWKFQLNGDAFGNTDFHRARVDEGLDGKGSKVRLARI